MFGRISKGLARVFVLSRLRYCFYLLLIIVVALILVLFRNKRPDVHLCFMDHPLPTFMYNNVERLDDVLFAEHKPKPGQSIFFHETTCHQLNYKINSDDYEVLDLGNRAHPAINTVKLTTRQACAIESAALHNPNFSVFVLFTSPTYRENYTTVPLLEALLSYSNVHLRNLNLWTYAAGTPISSWFKDGELFRSRFVLSHISDFLRYLTLYRFGGIYLDMDTVTLRSIEQLPPNFSGVESKNFIAAGVMGFAPDGAGHELAFDCLSEFQQNFDGNDWGNNGPGVITRVAQKLCRTTETAEMTQPERCTPLTIFEREAFYAIPWREWRHFFEPDKLQVTLERTKHSYVAHVWNKHSRQQELHVGTKAAYLKFAEEHCPKVVAAAGEYF